MNYLSKLFSKAPFDHLQLHMEKVAACLAKLSELFQEFEEAPMPQLELIATKVSEFEHEADLIKNDIRTALPKSYLFSLDRHNFLEILAIQDDLADIAEDIANILTAKRVQVPPEMREDFYQYVNKNMDAAFDAKDIIFLFDQLVEASFGGRIAEAVKERTDLAAYKEHEADIIKRKLMKHLFNSENRLTSADFYLWVRLIEDIGHISHHSEKLALRVGMLLQLK